MSNHITDSAADALKENDDEKEEAGSSKMQGLRQDEEPM